MATIDISNEYDNAPELTIMPEGTEAELRITYCKSGTDKNGNPYIMPMFEVVGEDTVRDFSRFIKLPNEGQKIKDKAGTIRALRTFGTAFGIDFSQPVEDHDILGKTGWAILGVETDQNGEPINKINRFVGGN